MMSHFVQPTLAAIETTEAQATIITPSTITTSTSMLPPVPSMSRLFWLLLLFVATCSGQEAQLGRPGGARIKAGSGADDWAAASVSLARTSSTSSSVQNVTAQNGQSVLLHCVVEPPSESGVSWFRGASEPQLLTSDSHTVIDDERFVVRRGLMADDDWALQIKNLDKSSDAGLYQCQTHSEPPRSQFYQLNIVEPQAHIAGAPDMAVKLGAAINLTCFITQLSDEMPFIFWYHNQQIINKRLSDSGRGKIVISRLAADGSAKSHSMAATLHISHSLLSDSGNYTCLPPGSGRPTSIYVHVLEGSNKRLIMFQNDQQYAPAWDGLAPPASSQQTNSAISVHVWRLTRGRAYALFVSLVIFSAWYQLVVQTPMLFSFLLLAIIGFFIGLVTDNHKLQASGERKKRSCPSDGQVAASLEAHPTATSPTTTDSALHLLKSASSGSENSLLATATTDLSATSSSARNRPRGPADGTLASPSSGSTSSSASTGYNSDARSSTRTTHRKRTRPEEPQESHLHDARMTSNLEEDMIELVTQPTALRLIMDEFSSTNPRRLLPMLAIFAASNCGAFSETLASPTGSGCDILLSAGEQATRECICEDRDESGSNLPTVSQLKCDASSLELISLLSTTHVAIDYFTLSLGTSSENHQYPPFTWNNNALSNNSYSRLQVQHMSLQLKPPHKSSRAANLRWPQMVQLQTLQLLHLINGSRLLSLTIFHEKSEQPQETELPRSLGESEVSLKLSELLSSLPNLMRLQLNEMPYKIHLNLATSSKHTNLRWLSLNSNEYLTFGAHIQLDDSTQCKSPIFGAYGLEQISLKANRIHTFPLSAMLGALVPEESYVGLPNLTSLNLASNLLRSFEKDLLQDTSLQTSIHECLQQRNPTGSSLFILPSLTQLDLSHNKLVHMTFEVGQQLLQIMPNLNHLYLHHNQIVHVSLNSLLTSQFPMPQSIYGPLESNNSIQSNIQVKASSISRLEYLDLSYNELQVVTAIFDTNLLSTISRSPQSNRFKSINLSHNHLGQPLQPIHSSYVNSIIFKESFDLEMANHLNFLTLQSTFTLASSHNHSLTICDFLSPSSLGEELLNEVILNDNQLTKLTERDFTSKKCKDIQILQLQRNRIGVLEKNALTALTDLEHLDISHNELDIISEPTFAKNSKLKLLNLAFNKLIFLNHEILSPLTLLEELFLQGNQLVELWNQLFIHNPLIGTLNLSYNRLKSIEAFTFEPLKQLKLLNLSGNQLNSFTHLLFSNSSSLVNDIKFSSPSNPSIKPPKIKLNQRPRTKAQRQQDKKKIDSSKKRKQRQIEESTVLVLTGNRIKLWNFNECNPFSLNVQSIWLDNNKLDMITGTSFKCFSSTIQRLYLQWNNIKAIEENALRNMSQLEYLDLSNNQLITIRAKTFYSLPSLRHIDLSWNQLINFDLVSASQAEKTAPEPTQIEFISLAHNTKLDLGVSDFYDFFLLQQQSTQAWRQIDLSCIGSINQNQASWNLTPIVDRIAIEFLNLSSNRHLSDSFLKFLSDPMFKIYRMDLTNITLENNSSHSVIAGLLKQHLSTSLSELYLSNNTKLLSPSVLKFLPQEQRLLHLDLSSSGLDSWPMMGPEIGSGLRSLNLSRNRLRSFIGNRQIDNYQELIRLETLDLSFNALSGLIELELGPPKQFEKKVVNLRYLAPSIKSLDLSHNQLTWIPDKFFEGANTLKSLKLSHNQLETFKLSLTYASVYIDLSFNHNLTNVVLEDESTEVEPNNKQYSDELLGGDNYIVFAEHREESQFSCKPLREFLASEARSSLKSWSQHDKLSSTLEDHESLGEQCSQLMAATYFVRLQSSIGRGHLLQLASVQTSANKLMHLSFRESGINQLESVETEKKEAIANNVILLDLSINKLKNLSHSFCRNLNGLRTLDLSFNHFTEFPTESVLPCSQLTYLDLSNNRLSRWPNYNNNNNTRSSIQVLKLAHNNLATLLDGTQLLALTRLRYIDLRGNRLSQMFNLQSLPLLFTKSTLVMGLDKAVLAGKPVLKVNGASLLVDVSEVSDMKLSQVKVKNVVPDLEEVSSKHQFKNHTFELSLCTLSAKQPAEICLIGTRSLCFTSRRPREVPSCVTNFQDTQVRIRPTANLESPQESPLPPDSLSNQLSLSPSSLTPKADDVVLNLIEYLKQGWLRLRELDLNEYLNTLTSVRGDSVWIVLNGRYPIYTVTLIKLAGSCCIIFLLLALFIILANASTFKRSNQSNSKHDLSSPTETCGSSNKSSGSDNSVLQTQISSNSGASNVCQLSSSLPSGSSSGSHRNEESVQLETVLERRVPPVVGQVPLKLNANHLLTSDHLQAQGACSTPSSSLAPSSAETAETLYAIDSIQSGYSSMVNRNSVDQYCFEPADTLDQQEQEQEQKQQVATVMRMIKSSSTNFDACANFRAPAGYLANQQRPKYGTLNQAPSSLHQQQQLYQSQFQLEPSNHSYGSLVYLNPPVCDEAGEREANNTVSLMSLDAVADRSLLNQQMSLELHQFQAHSHQPYQQHQNLCSYHRMLGAKDAAASVIEERGEEEEEPVSLGTLRSTMPSPPDSRAIAALEDPLLFLHPTSGSGSMR